LFCASSKSICTGGVSYASPLVETDRDENDNLTKNHTEKPIKFFICLVIRTGSSRNRLRRIKSNQQEPRSNIDIISQGGIRKSQSQLTRAADVLLSVQKLSNVSPVLQVLRIEADRSWCLNPSIWLTCSSSIAHALRIKRRAMWFRFEMTAGTMYIRCMSPEIAGGVKVNYCPGAWAQTWIILSGTSQEFSIDQRGFESENLPIIWTLSNNTSGVLKRSETNKRPCSVHVSPSGRQ
jgi:hypothetical protein